MAIPKIIHYCWFGRGQKPELAEKCIASWKKNCPDYIIKEWNEDNFDLDSNLYVRQAYDCRKFAFVSDYARLCALYDEGGIYMDTDVEILKPLDAFLHHRAFSSFENNDKLTTGLIASEAGNPWIKDGLDLYMDLTFLDAEGNMDLTTNVERITAMTQRKYGLNPVSSHQILPNSVLTIYPHDYFSPKDWQTGNIILTENSHTIHHFAGSWHTDDELVQIEKNRAIRNEAIARHGEEKVRRMEVRRNRFLRAVYYLKHPVLALKKIKEKLS